MKSKILIIEDEEIIRETTAQILELANYEVFTASDGKKGILIAQTENPDLIICDIMMPELDGYGVIHVLSKDPKTSGIPFIFLTAKIEKKDIRKGMALGADDYITKPFEEIDLLSAIESRLKRSQVLKQQFAYTREGLDSFIDNAEQNSILKNLYSDREPRSYKKKQIVYHEGDKAHHLYFISKGKVKLFSMHDDGKEYVSNILGEGDFFGYLELMEDVAYSNFAETIEDCEICRIHKEDFMQLLNKDRDVGNAFIKLITKRFYSQEKKLLSLAYDSVRKRTANVLLELIEKQKDVEAPPTILLSRLDLANMIGTASESLIRTLSDFKEEGLIIVDGKQIEIKDEYGLKKIK